MEQVETLVAAIPDMTPVDEKRLGSEVSDIEAHAGAFTITSDADYQKAGEFGRTLKQKAAEVTQFFKPMKDSAYQAHKAVCDREKAMLAPLRNAEQIIKKAMQDYQADQEQKRKNQQEEARKAALKECDRKLAEAIELEKSGDTEAAAAAMNDAEIMEEASKYAVVPQAKPKAQGVSTSKDWEIVSIDSKSVPLTVAGVEIRPVDRAAVMRLIRLSKGQIEIPGIAYREVAKISFRR